LKGDDEHLASIHASERDRLMDAIDQNCSLNHIEFLINTAGGMDVSVFQDAVLKRAIAAGSYNTLLWLHKTFMLQLDEIQDAKGNTLLHQLAMSPNVIRFLETVSSTHHVKDLGYYAYVHIDFSDSHAGPSQPGMIHRKNESGETWLDVLIRQGNVAALDFALNPTKGVVWLIPDRKTFERADAAALYDTALKSQNQDIIDTVTFFLSYHELRMQEIYLNYNVYKTEDMIINSDAMINFKKRLT